MAGNDTPKRSIYKTVGLLGLAATAITHAIVWLVFVLVLKIPWSELVSSGWYTWFPLYAVWLVFVVVGHVSGPQSE